MMPDTSPPDATSRVSRFPAPRDPDPLPAQPAGQAMFAWYAPGFSDALGDRLLLFDNTDGRPLELLRLRPEISPLPGFEDALRQRAQQLARFADPRYARVCRVDRLPDPGGGLAIVSEHVEGRRLSEVLRLAQARRVGLATDIALGAVRDLVGAIAALHEQGPSIAHAVLGPERIVVTPRGSLLVTEYVLGCALGQIAAGHRGLWRELGLVVPVAGRSRPLDQRGDVRQVGLTAVALLLGRPLLPEEEAPLGEVEERARRDGWDRSRSAALGAWLARALLVMGRGEFSNAVEARAALEPLVTGASMESASAPAVARFLAECTPAAAPPGEPGDSGVDNISGGLPTGDRLVAMSAGVTPGAAPAPQTLDEGDFLAFPSEAALPASRGRRVEEEESAPARRASAWFGRLWLAGRRRAWLVPAVLGLLVVAEAVYIGSRLLPNGSAPGSDVAMLRLESSPSRAAVSVDGNAAGATPTELRLAPGRHTVELAVGERRRSIVVTLAAGAETAQLVELPPPVASSGAMDVRSEPSGARVVVDGEPRGVTPVLLAGLATGAHEVRVDLRGRSVTQSVDVEQGGTSSVFVPFPKGESPTPGWLSISSPLELEVLQAFLFSEELLGQVG